MMPPSSIAKMYALLSGCVALVGLIANALAEGVVSRAEFDRSVWQRTKGGECKSCKAGEAWWNNSIQMEFSWIPAGRFMMGSKLNEAGRDEDEDVVDVELTHGYWLGRKEVTQDQWSAVMSDTPSWFSKSGGGRESVGDTSTGQLPVESVSWEDANEYCDRITQLEQRSGRLAEGWKCRLPTEAHRVVRSQNRVRE